MQFNLFHILGDVSHTCSKLILIWAIHSNSSAEGAFVRLVARLASWLTLTGVSLIRQVLYALVFATRYLDIFTSSATRDVWHTWNFSLKVRRLRISAPRNKHV